jgi:hypothetical protein
MLADGLDADVGAEMRQHFLGVITGRFLLDHDGLARRRQPRQQHGRLELGRRHRRRIFDRDRIFGALQRQWQPSAFGSVERAGPDSDQRVEHALHRPLAQRCIAVEYGRHRTAGDRTHDQPATGAGIAEIQSDFRLSEAGHANAAH